MHGPAPTLRLAGIALIGVAGVLAPVAAGIPTQTLKARDAMLAAEARSAVLGLYAIETKLARAHTRLALIERSSRAVRRERNEAANGLTIARRGVAISQARLATRVRGLYEHGEVDPIAVVFGAESLDAAVTELDNIGQLARGDQQVLAQVREARAALRILRHRLADRLRRLEKLAVAASATTQSLERARATRMTYLAKLRSQRQMTQAAIATLEERARAAREKARVLEAAEPATRSSAVGDTPTPVIDGRSLTVTATGYTLPGPTATGMPVGWGVAAVDASVIPLGSRFMVPGYGEAIAADVGGAVRGATIDLWFPSLEQAQGWGRRTVTITLH